MVELRSIDTDDALEVHRICAHPEVARSLGVWSDGLEGWKKRISEMPLDRTTFVGAFDGPSLLAVAHMQGSPRARQRHVARVWLAVDPAARGDVGPLLLGALCDAADRWWGYVRLEVDLHADDDREIELHRRMGFEVEVEKRCDMLRDGRIVDGAQLGRIRPGYVAPPELGAPAPIPARTRPRLEGKQLHVRPCRFDDAAQMAALHSTESVMEGTFATPFQSDREWRMRLAANDSNVRALAAIAEGKVAGSAALFQQPSPRVAHVAGFGMSVHPDFQGRGVGDALMRAILELADRWLGVRRVQLEVYSDNLRAQALYRKHGFEEEGVQRLAAFRRGTYVDAIVMSRIRSAT